MPQPSYAYGVARIRALEPKLLPIDRIERMVDAQSAEEALKVLSETEYGLAIAEMEGPWDYEQMLSREIKKIHGLIKSISPNPEITDMFFLKYDIHNLKTLLKARYMEKERHDLLVDAGTVSLDILKKAIMDKDYSSLPPFLKEAAEKIDNVLSLKVDPQTIDLVLDRAMYSHIFSVCRRHRNSFALEYFTKQVDLINIRSLLRVWKIGEGIDFLKELLIPYGKLDTAFYGRAIDESPEQLIEWLAFSDYGKVVAEGVQAFVQNGSLTVFERVMDNYLLDFVKSARRNPFGIEPIVGYLLAKENEVKLIRIVMVGKINNISPQRIRERLRDAYV